MIRRPHRLPSAIAVIACFTALPCPAQPAGSPVTANDTVLRTQTPLGEAAIVWPAGTVLTEPVGSGEEIPVRQGPFTARLDRSDIVFPSTPAPPDPEPETRPPEPDPAPQGAQRPEWLEDWRIVGPAGAAILLGLYSLVATVALVRERRRNDA